MSLNRITAGLGLILVALLAALLIIASTGFAAGARAAASATPTASQTAVRTPGQSPAPASATPTRAATATAAPTPTGTPTPAPTLTKTPAPALTPPPDRKVLPGISWVGQTWNNCGPATLSMVLGFYGIRATQAEIGKVMHPDPAGKHVGPQEMLDYLAAKGLAGKPLVNGTQDVLTRLVANGIPVITSGWIRNGEDIGHYRLVKGYDRPAGVLVLNDAYWGQDYRVTPAAFDAIWWPFNRFYMPVYRPEQEALVRAILGEDWDRAVMLRKARAAAEAATAAKPSDAYAWFNLGDDLLALDDAAGAVKAYERALKLDLPGRMLWYRYEPLVAYNRAGQYQRVLDLSEPVLAWTNGVAQVYEQRGFAYVGLANAVQAAAEFRLALQYDPALTASRDALAKLSQ